MQMDEAYGRGHVFKGEGLARVVHQTLPQTACRLPARRARAKTIADSQAGGEAACAPAPVCPRCSPSGEHGDEANEAREADDFSEIGDQGAKHENLRSCLRHVLYMFCSHLKSTLFIHG